jgi:hypothetical protein
VTVIKNLLQLSKLASMLGKSPYKSWTVWGLALWAGAAAVVHSLCPEAAGDGSWATVAGGVSHSTCATLVTVMEKGGAILAGLGIRRKL